MTMPSRRTATQTTVLTLLLPALLLLPGCGSPQPRGGGAGGAASGSAGGVAAAKEAYGRGDYAGALARAAGPAQHGDAQAAYLAGVASLQLSRPADAVRYLQIAARDPGLRPSALVNLGLAQAQLNQHHAAAAALLEAAPRLAGEDRAKAYFYAAISQQKLGQWAQARTSLSLARGATRDPALLQQIDGLLDVAGYTLQVAAFADAQRATAAARDLAPRSQRAGLGAPRLATRTTPAGQTLTAVQVGSFASFDAATRAKATLGDRNAVVVPLSR